MCKDNAVAVRENRELLLHVRENQTRLAAQAQIQLDDPPVISTLPNPDSYEDPWAPLQQAQDAARAAGHDDDDDEE